MNGLSPAVSRLLALALLASAALGAWVGIVEHFEESRTRSIERPKLDLDIQFEFGSATLTERARKDLDQLGAALAHPAMKTRRFELSGHTDDVGREAYNEMLSMRRANAVRAALVALGIDESALMVAGQGEFEPIIPTEDGMREPQNRRVSITLGGMQ